MELNANVVGAGLAGAEAAWQLAKRGVSVCLYEMKPVKRSPAHKADGFAELVCSNSLRSDDCRGNAVGLLHQEMRLAGSLVMESADKNRVPAGGALAVDREGFSAYITAKLKSHPLITVVNREVTALPPPERGLSIIATGPLKAINMITSTARLMKSSIKNLSAPCWPASRLSFTILKSLSILTAVCRWK